MLKVLFENKKIFQISQKWRIIQIVGTIKNRIDRRKWFRIRDKSIREKDLKVYNNKFWWHHIIIIIIGTEREINIRIITKNKI